MKEAIFYYKDKNAPNPNRPSHIGTSVLVQYQDELLIDRGF